MEWRKREKEREVIMNNDFTYHAPINLLQKGIAIKAHANPRNEEPKDQGQDAHVIEAQPQVGDGPGVVQERVVETGQGQGEAGREQEEGEDDVVEWGGEGEALA